MNTTRTIKILNSLIEINNDRIEGYATAIDETKDADLKNMFSKFSQTSKKCRLELVVEVLKLQGRPTEETRTTGKFFRAWMDAKAALTASNRRAILNSCEYGESVAVETYENVLIEHLEDLSSEQKILVKAQHNLILTDHNLVRGMRDLAIIPDLLSKN